MSHIFLYVHFGAIKIMEPVVREGWTRKTPALVNLFDDAIRSLDLVDRHLSFFFFFYILGGAYPKRLAVSFLLFDLRTYGKRRFWTHRVCNSHDWIVRSSFFSKASVTQRHISWQVYSKSVLFLTASISFFFSFCGNWCTSGSVLEGRNTKDTGIKRALARKSGRHLDVVGFCLRSEKYDFLFRQSKNDSAKRKVNHFDLVVRINWNNSHLLLPHFR